MSDDDIYDDLETCIFTEKQKTDNDERLSLALNQVEGLKEENKRLLRENKAYATNISSLYLTAKNEIDKKSHIIKVLQAKLKDMTILKAQTSQLTKPEIDKVLKQFEELCRETSRQTTMEEIEQAISKLRKKGPKRRKQFKFGNMSVYFACRQGSFPRQGRVVTHEQHHKS